MSRACRSACVALTVVAVGLHSAMAHAQSGASADALFRDAQASVERRDFDRACALFQESQRLDPAPGTVLNWADCEESRGRVAQAWQLFVRAKETLPEGDSRVDYAAQRIARVAPRVPHVTFVAAPGAHRPLHVRLDDADYTEAALGIALPVDPGKHLIRVDAPGYRVAEVPLVVAESESKTVALQTGPLAPMERREPPSSTPATLGWALTGLGALALGTGIVSGALVVSDVDTYKAHCTPDCDPQGASAAHAGRPLGILSPIALGVGLVSAGAGIYLVWTSRSEARVRMSWDGISGEF